MQYIGHVIRLKYVLFDTKLDVFQGLRQRSTSEAQELSADINVSALKASCCLNLFKWVL